MQFRVDSLTHYKLSFYFSLPEKDGERKMNYIVLDVETANPDYSSICQIGIVNVIDGAVVDKQCLLINPETYFDPVNTSIHGIDEEMVAKSPSFGTVFETLSDALTRNIIVHHGPFDRIAMTRAQQRYGIDAKNLRFLDNQAVVRRVWEDVAKKGYGLSNLAKRIGYEFKHHNALEDALATQAVFEIALSDSGKNIEDWLINSKKPITSKIATKFTGGGNPEGRYFGERIVFTGTLSVPRADAAKSAQLAGFEVANSVTKDTDILVVGIADETKFADGYKKSSKQRTAEKLVAEGYPINIVFEDNFWDLLQS